MTILIPITFFAMIAAIFLLPGYLRSRERMALQETLRAAYQNGQPVPPEVIEAITQAKPVSGPGPGPNPVRDIRVGIIWLAVGLGFGGIGWAIGYASDSDNPFAAVIALAAIPTSVGVALLAMGLVGLAAQPKAPTTIEPKV